MESMDLSDCTYERIKGTFYYGIFGDFKLVVDRSTGYFNATKLAKEGQKKFDDWKILENSKRLMDYYERRYHNSDIDFLYEAKGDNQDKLDCQIIGTYVPKELILAIASWISTEFYDKCNSVIVNFCVNRYKSLSLKMLQRHVQEAEEKMVQLSLKKQKKLEEEIKVKDDKIDELKIIMLRQEQYMNSLGISLHNIQRKLGIEVEDCPHPKDEPKIVISF
jgi:hypothetical protein